MKKFISQVCFDQLTWFFCMSMYQDLAWKSISSLYTWHASFTAVWWQLLPPAWPTKNLFLAPRILTFWMDLNWDFRHKCSSFLECQRFKVLDKYLWWFMRYEIFQRLETNLTRPIVQWCVLSILHYAFCDGASGNGVVGAVMVVVVAVMVTVVAALAEAMLPLRMIVCLQIVCFPCFLKRRNGRTYGWTYGPTDLRTDRPSYRDARTHLKSFAKSKWGMAFLGELFYSVCPLQ